MAISTNDLLTALRWRYATKKFDATRKISAETWSAIEESMILTPSSFGLQPWKFLVINHAETREKLCAESWAQQQVKDASHYVVLTARTDVDANDIETWVKCMAAAQGTPAEAAAAYEGVIKGFANGMTQEARHAWNVRQVYIALGQLMAAAATLGIDACPMEGINPAGYDQILNLRGTGYATAVACAVGYRADDDKYAKNPKARFPKKQIIQHI
jgi:nitroreductase